MNTLDEIFTKYNIVKFERSTFKGYEDYPAIGLFNKDGVEIAQIADRTSYYITEEAHMVDENGDDVQEDNPFESNAKCLFEIHTALAFRTKSEYRKVSDVVPDLNEWLCNEEVMVTVAYRINGKDVEDPCEYFYKELLKLLKPKLKEACSESKSVIKMKHIVDTYKYYDRYKENYIWRYFKEDYGLPKSWSIAAFKKEAKRATIKLIGKV